MVLRRLLFAVLLVGGCKPSDRQTVRPSERIVSLLPSFTEILFDIGAGDRVVGRTQWCDYPPAALAVPSVGDGMPPNIEAVLARRPDLVVLYNSGPNVAAAKQFERIGIKTALIDLNRLQDLGAATRELGRLTGQFDQADSLANILDSIAGQAMPPPTTSVAFVVWDNPPIIIGRGSYLDQIAAAAGARNVFTDIAAPSAQVSLETIVDRNPEWIAVLSDSGAMPSFARRPEWRAIRAVRERHFLLLKGSLFGRPGPRSGQAIAELKRMLAK
ncbi:MAG TPA: helical backbone metal receptor [Gemmatimonadales bacterium]|jgi:ABC-type Fe3+-hydroxamate transport system substrate-binding protein